MTASLRARRARLLFAAFAAPVCLFAADRARADGIAASVTAPASSTASSGAPPAATTAPASAPTSAQPPTPASACVDEELKRELVGGRHYRGVQPRLFTKSLRHELSLLGGWRAGDAADGSPWVGGSYTFHFSEDLGLEALFGWTRNQSRVADVIQKRFPQPIEVFQNQHDVKQYFGHLVWTLGYGKIRWMGGAISRFDFHIAAGGGLIDDSVSTGLAGSFGIGGKLYLGSWAALRFDVRDQIYPQTLLDDTRVVNDILVSAGLSMFIPFSG